MDQIILEKHCDVDLKEDENVLALAYMNSHFQTGLKNILDRAILAHSETHAHASIPVLAISWDDADLLLCPHATCKDLAPSQEVDLSDDLGRLFSKRASFELDRYFTASAAS
jgi:hypothetical protein